ncbi:hypothetical protein CEP52_005332 [Fusarium oligoseptatum]|uniref:Cyclase n=1 Tax=Fusarium oligoseptatum TaxID=2604345 RepID=A0A428TYV0_9HYPO|nr:hypothetical protein CEP52_005332 [Fusarium oligoseptatum]
MNSAPDVVRDAAKEIQTGVRFQLDLRLDHFDQRVAGREGFKHQIFDFKKRLPGTMYDFYGHDDVLIFNTQSSSQWDGYRHIGIQESTEYYKGTEHQHVVAEGAKGRMGIHKWVENGGIVGRGILLDYHRWRAETGKPPVPANSTFAITVEELDEVARHQGTEFRPGDILVIRTGFTAWHLKASDEDKKTSTEKGAFIGVESSMASVRWLWNHHFAAVACDTLGFECTPIAFSDSTQTRLHDWAEGFNATRMVR